MSFICNEIYSKPFLEKVRKLSERYLAYKIGQLKLKILRLLLLIVKQVCFHAFSASWYKFIVALLF